MFFRSMMLFAVASGLALAEQTQPRLEMDADGDVVIAADGQVAEYHLKSQLAPAVAGLVDRAVHAWHFEPIIVDGVSVRAKTAMHLGLLAEPAGKDNYAVKVSDVRFGDVRLKPGAAKKLHYPPELVRARVGGKVMLSLHLDATGKVVEAYPYQTSLDVRTRTEADAQRYRAQLEKASVEQAKEWQYELSETMDGKPRAETYILTPISYFLVTCQMPCKATPPETDGKWKGYMPGPIHPAPWSKPVQVATGDLESLKDGQALSLNSGVHLKDDVIGKAL